MARKKVLHECHLREIRIKEDYTQDEFAEQLDIPLRTYQEYEYENSFLPHEIAKKIHQKWGYSFEYIYKYTNIDKHSTNASPYMVDIRKVINIEEGKKIIFNISKEHWDYLLDKYTIQSNTTLTKKEKKHFIRQLNINFKFIGKSIVLEYEVPACDFMAFARKKVEKKYIKIPYSYDDNLNEIEKTERKLKQ